jgi:hypothetical protein
VFSRTNPGAFREEPWLGSSLVTDIRSLAAQTLSRVPVELAAREAHRHPALTTIWNRQSLTAMAVAVCGLASVTWLEVRSVGIRSPLADAVMNAPTAPIVSRQQGGTTKGWRFGAAVSP